MEAEAEVVLSGLEAVVTRIDDSDDEEPSLPTWRDEASACEDMGRSSDVRNVWARVGDVEDQAVDPTLLDSLAEDLVVPPHTNLGDIGLRGSDAVDDCSSVSSESCWGEMEDVGDEAVAWGVLPDPPSCQADVSHYEGNRERPGARRLQLLVSSQTVAPSLTCNRFVALMSEQLNLAVERVELAEVGLAELEKWPNCVLLCVVIVVGPSAFPRPLDRPPPDCPKFRFFPLSRHQFRSFFSLSVSSLNFGGFCEDRDPQMCTFGLSGCGVKPQRHRGRRGFTQQPENSKRAHFTAPTLPNTTKKTNQESETGGGRRKKKTRNFGPPTLPFGAPPFESPLFSGPHFFWVWAHPSPLPLPEAHHLGAPP